MQGKIVKGIAGFYYVHIPDQGVYECKARGILRKEGVKPLAGDNCEVDILDEEEKKGNLIRIEKRKNVLIRPPVSNVDQALVIFAAAKPAPNLNLLDRFLVMMSKQQVETIVCFNKTDLLSDRELRLLSDNYAVCGYRVVTVSALLNEGISGIKQLLSGKTTVLAGPSGVGKSSLINRLAPDAEMETGEISRKIDRGRHTTRHSELFCAGGDTYIMDTPGFSSLSVAEIGRDELKNYFREFSEYEGDCRFQGCAHIHEPDCAVLSALSEGKISRLRYDNYVLLYEELNRQKKY